MQFVKLIQGFPGGLHLVVEGRGDFADRRRGFFGHSGNLRTTRSQALGFSRLFAGHVAASLGLSMQASRIQRDIATGLAHRNEAIAQGRQETLQRRSEEHTSDTLTLMRTSYAG